MSRDIKFRAWIESEKRMVTPYMWINESNFPAQEITIKPAAIMQYTGLKDKNGVEIYEGDIVKYNNWSSTYHCDECGHKESSSKNMEVMWSNLIIYDDFCESTAKFMLNYGIDDIELGDTKNLEVIGNIYESPELLKG